MKIIRTAVAGARVIARQNLAMYSLLIQIPFVFAGSDADRIWDWRSSR